MIFNFQGLLDSQVHWLKNLQVRFEIRFSKVVLNYRIWSSHIDRGLVLKQMKCMKQCVFTFWARKYNICCQIFHKSYWKLNVLRVTVSKKESNLKWELFLKFCCSILPQKVSPSSRSSSQILWIKRKKSLNFLKCTNPSLLKLNQLWLSFSFSKPFSYFWNTL